jgi:hypothetical protein
MSNNWKSQASIDELSDLKACSKPEVIDTCNTHCQEEGTGIMSAEGLPFCNELGKPSIPMDFGGHAVLRNGSRKQPIQLTELQSKTVSPFKRLMGVTEAGALYSIIPPKDGETYKVVADDDGFKFAKDITANSIDASDVQGEGDPDFVVGGKITTDANGNSVMRLMAYDISQLLNYLDVDCDVN